MPILTGITALVDRIRPPERVHAHCDLPCGVYDPAQARIEAQSVKGCQEKFQASDDEVFRQRAVQIKEERADLVKHHLWVLWTDYFKPEHVEKYPQLHQLFWDATKAAGATKKSEDPASGDQLLDLIGQIDTIFWETKKA
ncbi:MAG TPA: superoxide dismutase, Ni [Acidimicrobiales bacterium]|jgi:nickel superoxide dismutase|nr:superoxide dismutase, Ni [Acidimicrobiales bacterium]